MALAFVRQNKNSAVDGTAVTTCTVTLPSVGAGSLIAVFLKYEGATTTTSVSDGTNTLTAKTEKAHTNNDVRGRWFFLESAGGSGSTVTFTCTFGAARSWWGLHVFEFSYSGTASFDVEPAGGGGQGTSTAPNSGSMTTTGTDEVVLGGYCNYSSSTISSPSVGGSAASGLQTDTIGDSTWYRILSATMTGAASATISPSGAWVCCAIALKVAASGGGGFQSAWARGANTVISNGARAA